jgi:hypothetical protein
MIRSVSRRRFTILAVALVALNAFFWLAQSGFALPKAVITQFFGNKLIRAEVIMRGPTATTPLDYRIDRGVITSAGAGSITLLEQDGTSYTATVASDARIVGPGRFRSVDQLRKGLRVVVYRAADAPAELIQVEGRGALP